MEVRILTKKFVTPYQGRTITDKSKTIPDQSMPLKLIVQRYVRGLPVNVTPPKNLAFSGDEVANQFDNLDIEEMTSIMDNGRKAKEEINRIRKEKADSEFESKLREKITAEMSQNEKDIEAKIRAKIASEKSTIQS